MLMGGGSNWNVRSDFCGNHTYMRDHPIGAACISVPGFGRVFEYPSYCFSNFCGVVSRAGG